MRESPRIRRLRSDHRALEELRAESTIVDFVAYESPHGTPPEVYLLRFYGRGLWRPEGEKEILIREQHEVRVRLGASYPRMMPELSWRSPIFHPNISSSGVVCLGGYGTYWVPSLGLSELCTMLWDMVRYENYDIESPYNREAALWARQQLQYRFPVDSRPLRDRVAQGGRVSRVDQPPIVTRPKNVASDPDVTFLETAVVEAEVIVEPEDPDILFIQ